MGARYRPAGEKRAPQPCIRSTAPLSAVGRTLIAILENGQNHDGTVAIPRRCSLIWADSS